MKHFFALLLFSTQAIANISETSFSAYSQVRDERKIGVGAQMLGASGTVGLLLEINFHPSWGLNIGYGNGSDFQTFLVEYKQILSIGKITTYGLLGFTRWFGESESSIDSTNPGFVADEFMSSSDRRRGVISENLIYPGVGVQYVLLSGDWQGLSAFGHVILLSDLEDFAFAPTLAIGTLFYF
jgi:hypothetical protein